MRKFDRRRVMILSIGIIIVVAIFIGTLDIFFGNGILGLLLYGIVLAIITRGFSSELNIFTGSGLVRRRKRDNLPRSKGKPPLSFTFNGDLKGIMHGMETGNEEIRNRPIKDG